MDFLALNTYAGSILCAAREVGIPIRGSYEDAGYGSTIAKANFPDVRHKERTPWPEDDLSQTIVLAHPPCSAWSQQNNSSAAKGNDAKKFACTLQVLEYALKNRCAALAIESVIPALEGARSVHDEAAKRHGYAVFRLLQNSISFGLPQWRPRFWVLFIPEGRVHQLMVDFTPRYRCVGQLMAEAEPGPADPTLERDWQRQLDLLKVKGFSDPDADELLNSTETFGSLPGLIKKFSDRRIMLKGDVQHLRDMDNGRLAKEFCVGGNFMSHCLRVLDPAGYATTLLFDSWWACQGRVLSYAEYNAVMGFPRSYIFPGKTQPKFREFLSRGVCPPVASWVIRTLLQNLNHITVSEKFRCLPGETLDLLPQKDEVKFG